MKSEVRPLSPRQMGAAYKLSVAVHFLIREIDDLQSTSMFRQKLKMTAKSFLKELEVHAAETLWTDGESEGDINNVYDQMDALSTHFGNLLITAIASDRLKPGEQTMFWQDMQIAFKRHAMPLRIDHNGNKRITMKDLVIDFDRPESKQFLYGVLKELKGEQVIKIKTRSKGRSLKENKFYWGVVLQYISDYTGHSPNQVHEYYKHEFIPLVKFTDDYRLTTTDMTHEQIWNYIDKVRLDAKERLGVLIPDPDGVML